MDYGTSQKSTLKQTNSTLKSYEKFDYLLKDPSPQYDNENKKLGTSEKNRFRIRDSKKEDTPTRSTEEQDRLKDME